jgi:hypothetical protein
MVEVDVGQHIGRVFSAKLKPQRHESAQ